MPTSVEEKLGGGKLLIDREIKTYVEKYDMVRPFSDRLNSQGVISWGLSSMGYGLASAMGLQLLEPERRVACVLGDGGFAMFLGELETVVRRELPIVAVILADQALTQIKLGQDRKGLPATGTTFGPLDYVGLARAFGADGAEIHRLNECRDVLRWAVERRAPTIVAAYIDPECYRLQ